MTDDDTPTGYSPTELGEVVETEANTAWSLDDGPEVEMPRRFTPGRITAAAVAGSLIIAGIATGVAWHHWRDATPPTMTQPTPNAAPATTISSSPESEPPGPAELPGIDGEFVRQMRGFGVPVSDDDPQWIVDLARATCAAAVEGAETDYPPGTATVTHLVETLMNMNPDWTRQQASRFTSGTIDQYCPSVRGPSRDEIAALPDDERYLAVLQDRIGITPIDGDDSLLRVARQVCIWSGQGWNTDRMVEAINSNNPPEDERVIIDTAVDVYCPQYR